MLKFINAQNYEIFAMLCPDFADGKSIIPKHTTPL